MKLAPDDDDDYAALEAVGASVALGESVLHEVSHPAKLPSGKLIGTGKASVKKTRVRKLKIKTKETY